MRTSKGFTLIELMIVITIIGILAAIMTPKVTAMVAKAHDGKTFGNLATLRSVIGVYYANNEGHYPSFSPPYSAPGGYSTLLHDALVPNYLNEIPEANGSGNYHPSSNWVDTVWNQTGNEDSEGSGYGQGWKYDANPFDLNIYPDVPGFGSIKVLCTHLDAKGINWSVY